MSSSAPLGPEDARPDLDEALALARGSDEDAFGAIFVELQPRLLRFLRAREPSAADDIAAEVWLNVARDIASFDGNWNDFRAWFFTVARRRVTDHRRGHARRPADVVDPRSFDELRSNDIIDNQVVAKLSGQEAATLLATLLNQDQAEVILLRVLGDLDPTQIAAIMGKTANWVRVTQHRAVRRLARVCVAHLLPMM